MSEESPDLTMNSPPDSQPSVHDKRIAHANKVVKIDEKYETPTTIRFIAKEQRANISIAQKHRDLFSEIKKIDDAVTMKDQNDKEYLHL